MTKKFYKYTSAGNDFIIFNGLNSSEPMKSDWPSTDQVASLCHRRFGVGADGVIVIAPAQSASSHFQFLIKNSDGSTPTMCGNGLRAAVHFFHHHVNKESSSCYRVETPHGIWEASTGGEGVALKGEIPQVVTPTKHSPWEGVWYNSGVPHFVKQEKHLREMGHFEEVAQSIRQFEGFPEGTNVSFFDAMFDVGGSDSAQNLDSIYVRTFERGVEGETMACGTGVLACAFHVHRLGAAEQIKVSTPGGVFHCRFFSNQFELIGPTEFLFEGKLPS